jgi:hypothetical protein
VRQDAKNPRLGVCPDGHNVPVYVTETKYVEAFAEKNDQCGEPECTRPVEAPGFKRCRPCITLGSKKRRKKAG